jgi:hypothetical protein
VLLLFAGHENTAGLIANGLALLLEHPDQLALLRERPDLAPSAVEEMLRYDGPASAVMRVSQQPVELAGIASRRTPSSTSSCSPATARTSPTQPAGRMVTGARPAWTQDADLPQRYADVERVAVSLGGSAFLTVLRENRAGTTTTCSWTAGNRAAAIRGLPAVRS